MSTWQQAKTPKTQAQLRTLLLAALASGGAPVAGWSDTAPQRIIVDDLAARGAEASEIRAELARMVDVNELALDATDPSWADAFATSFAETRIGALPAVWDVPLTSTSLPASIGPGELLLQSTGSGAPFFAVAPGAARVALPGSVRVTCRTAGTVGNVAPNTFSVSAAPAGTVGNGTESLYTAGREAESNSQLIRRCLAKWSRLGAGWTEEAIAYLIQQAAPSVTRWRIRTDNPFGPGTTGVTLANASGPATGPEVAAVSALLNARRIRPCGSGPCTVAAATLDALGLTITIQGDGTNATLADDIKAGLAALAGPFAIGPAILQLELVQAVAMGAAFTSITVDDGSGGLTTIPVNVPGFRGAVSIVSCSLAADHDIAADAVLVVAPTATVT